MKKDLVRLFSLKIVVLAIKTILEVESVNEIIYRRQKGERVSIVGFGLASLFSKTSTTLFTYSLIFIGVLIMGSTEFRHWVRLEDLRKLLNQSQEELATFCEREKIIPRVRRRGQETDLSVFDAQARQVLEASGHVFPNPAMRIACMMCKGGVGKTTTAYFLGLRLASYGAKVLFIDADPQANLTSALGPDNYGYNISENSAILLDVLSKRCSPQEAVLKLTPHLHLIPSTAVNSLVERKLLEQGSTSLSEFSQSLDQLGNDYNYIIIDCAPSVNLVNASIVRASNLVLLPIQLDEFSRSGLNLTLGEIFELQERFDFKTEIRILLNRFNPVEKLSFLYLGHLAEKYRPLMMQSAIRQSSEIKLSLTLKQDLFRKSKSRAKDDFDGLAREVMHVPMRGGEFNAQH